MRILRDVADALTDAHAHGVVHRDIKPENVMLPGRHALVTDFGVAKAVSEATGGRRSRRPASRSARRPTWRPEQAAADPHVDHRADIYAVGVMAYEMLTGRPPFTGADPAGGPRRARDRGPEPVTRSGQRCRRRWRRWSCGAWRSSRPTGARARTSCCRSSRRWPRRAAALTPTDTQPVPAARGRRLPAAGWLVVAGVLVIAGIVWAIAGSGRRGPAPSPFLGAIPVQLTTSGQIWGGAPSPDGSLLAYAEVHCEGSARCHGDLVIRETAGEGVSTIAAPNGHSWNPQAWSPDGRWVAFLDWDIGTTFANGLYIVSQRGGTPRRIAPGSLVAGGFVAPDTLVLTPWEGPRHWLRRVVASTGAVVDSVVLPVSRYVLSVTPSPGGVRLLIYHEDQLGGDTATLSIVDRGGRTTDSLRVPGTSRGPRHAVWAGGADAVILDAPLRSNSAEGDVGLVLVRRRIDGRGLFLPGADTLKTFAEGTGTVFGVSADGTQLFYQMARVGEVGLWTATRSDARGAFARGRKVGSSTGALVAWVSPRGAWILSKEISATSTGTRTRLAVEPFAGGERHVIEPALVGYRDLAVAPTDDSVAVATDAGSGRTAINVYPLPSGAPVPRGSFEGVPIDLRWLADGRLVTAVDSGRVIRMVGRSGEVKDLSVPDSLGVVWTVAPSPVAPELAVATMAMRGDRILLMIHRLNPDDGRYTLVSRFSAFNDVGNLAWTTDGWLHLRAAGPGDERTRLYRVPVGGGAWEAEPPIGFESNASVTLLSYDGRRGVVRARSVNGDLWVLRAAGPK